MSSRNFVLFTVLAIIFINASLILFNIVINPYKIFPTPELKINNITNHSISDRVSKFYSAKRLNPNILMMGSSRIGSIHPKYLEKYTNGRIYNLSLGGSHISEQYYYSKYFIENYDISTIVLALDFQSFFRLEDSHYQESHFDINRLNNKFYFNDYILGAIGKKALVDSWDTLLDSIKKPDENDVNYKYGWVTENEVNYDNGWVTYYRNYRDFKKQGIVVVKKRIRQKLESYAKHSLKDSKSVTNDILDNNITYLNKLIELCNQNNITLKMSIFPTHAKHIDLIYTRGFGDSFEYWKTNVVKIADIYDFSGRNTITNNPENYMDSSHINSNVGSVIFARMFNDDSITIPKDFGILLNKENIHSFLINYRKKINY